MAQWSERYLATHLDTALDQVLAIVVGAAGIVALLAAASGVEITERHGIKGTYLFVLNHDGETREIALPTPMRDLLTRTQYSNTLRLAPQGIAILIADG